MKAIKEPALGTLELMLASMSMVNMGSVGQLRPCPCGDSQCFLEVEGFKDDELIDSSGLLEPSASLEMPSVSFGADKVVIPPPYVGQSFQSDDGALEYYSSYARNNGFLVRRERSKGNPDHPMGVYKRELVCHRVGPPLPVKLGEAKRRKKKPSRCKCEAQMVIKKNTLSGVTRWVVVNFSNVHNHELLGSNEMQYSPGHRYISQVDRKRILALAKGGCNVSLIMRALEMERGVKPGQLTFSERDLSNFLHAVGSINPENDGSELLKSCKAMKEKNPDFLYEFTSFENNKLEHIAWSYVGSIRAYKVFGDVVFFDTTHRLCAYNRPIGIWFGIDNHGHIIFFGCVILIDESMESYRWALKAFLRLMDGKFPLSILTDFNLGLKDMILNEMPDTKHAFAFSHIEAKLPSWFSAFLGQQYERFKSEFCRIYKLGSEEEFEHGLEQMVMEFGLLADRHMAMLSAHHHHWAVPYLRSWFFGGLLTTSHSLPIKSFLQRFSNSQTCLKDFVEQVGVAVDLQNQEAEEATMQQSQENLEIKTCSPIEEHASTVLTHYAFKMFQKEITLSAQYAVYETSRDSYLVEHHLKTDRGHIVNCLPSSEEFNCTCKEFESSGILCRHALQVLFLKNGFVVPEKYLLPRWRRETSLFPKCSGHKYRSQALKSLASIIIQESAITKGRFEYVQWHLSKLLSQVREIAATDEATSGLEFNSVDATVEVPPVRLANRGRPRKLLGITKCSNGVHTSQ